MLLKQIQSDRRWANSWGQVSLTQIMQVSWLSHGLTWAAVTLELCGPLLLLHPKLRPRFVWVFILFHICIFSCLRFTGVFNLTTIVALMSFFVGPRKGTP